ncbi:hypothetical protein CY34DRAFT_19098 [Suillus luteus UH-Slu-Lm8-n1]|uniref:Uncharacterized protein n=1 Tax=Suillus luteus UH-Slu-Lm8-n1 TaxID=930992 RepID=A0A0C9ZSW1_9AGAM|nr:hypothetical protein CY34DRAFT_19098 [Suillus luteus UH-Slu-Lm8-n1]
MAYLCIITLFPAKLTSPLSRPRANSPVRSSSDKGTQKAHGPRREVAHTVDVPLGQATYADVVGVDDGERPYVLFFCLSWFQKKKKKEVPRPVYDDELEDDEEEENVCGPAGVPPPRALHEEIELTLAGHNQRQD